MHAQVDSMQEKIDQCTKQASEALKKDRKAHALSYIRSRKQLQELLAKRLSSLATLESTLITVEAAAGDVAIMKSYESSTSTLKAILSHPSLQRENVDKTMEALAEANASAKEIDDAVRMGGDVALGVDEGVDDGEIEKEWEELVRQMGGQKESEGEEQRERLSGDALKVPSGAPQEEGGKSLEKQMAALSLDYGAFHISDAAFFGLLGLSSGSETSSKLACHPPALRSDDTEGLTRVALWASCCKRFEAGDYHLDRDDSLLSQFRVTFVVNGVDVGGSISVRLLNVLDGSKAIAVIPLSCNLKPSTFSHTSELDSLRS
ncbi:hypothetical protein NMY22_g19029 [Coprinellus aureogranulatus]|nr:hypothetical protein NMY22_g19029 [Coprinellus aureogranulatus]